MSRWSLYRKFLPYLTRPLSPEIIWNVLPPRCMQSSDPWVYGADGKWLHHQRVCLIHRDVTHKENLWWSAGFNESYASWSADGEKLSDHLTEPHYPFAAVSDWKRGLIQTVLHVFGDIPHQRCLAHVARQGCALLPKGSPFLATRKLRDIAKALRNIKTTDYMHEWERNLTRWGYLYGDMLTEKTRAPLTSTRHWWYTHGNLRRGWRLLTTGTDSFFVFLGATGIPKTNNSLEGVNRNFKGKLGIHRGLTTDFQVSLFFWVMTFSRVKNPEDLKKLWAAWNRRL